MRALAPTHCITPARPVRNESPHSHPPTGSATSPAADARRTKAGPRAHTVGSVPDRPGPAVRSEHTPPPPGRPLPRPAARPTGGTSPRIASLLAWAAAVCATDAGFGWEELPEECRTDARKRPLRGEDSYPSIEMEALLLYSSHSREFSGLRF